jgi:hypothetical protein
MDTDKISKAGMSREEREGGEGTKGFHLRFSSRPSRGIFSQA